MTLHTMDCQKLRIVFAGTPDFAVPALEALRESCHQVVGVLTQPDRPAGRGRKIEPGPVHQCAIDAGFDVLQPLTLRDPDAVSWLEARSPDVIVVVAYGLLLPAGVLALPAMGCVNIHGSLLPRWRGAAPVARAVLAGDERSGITLMQMDAGLDTGPMLATRAIPITATTTGQQLHDQLAQLGAGMLVPTLEQLCRGEIEPVAQDDEQACYADKLHKEEARIDWHQSAVSIDRRIRAFIPWPVAESLFQKQRLRIWSSSVDGVDCDQPPGTIIAADHRGLQVACGQGVLQIESLQPAGKRVMSAADFARSRNVVGQLLG